MKKILLLLLIITMTAAVYAEPLMGDRPFEVTKYSYDPYIAEKGGFDSLFVNPAGMAGQTEAFVYELEAGTFGKAQTYKTLSVFIENSDLLTGGSAPQTPADMAVIIEIISSSTNQTDLNTLTALTALTGMSPAQIVVYLESNTLSTSDVNQLGTNFGANSAIIDAAMSNLLGSLKVTVEATNKAGTLISGFGVGIYGNAFMVFDAAQLGFQQFVGEAGIKVGYGFSLGPLDLGISGDFASIGRLSDSSFASIMNASVVYGYAWGFDVGATIEVLPGLTIGAVMTDVIGAYSDVSTSSVMSLLNGDDVSTDIPYRYSFDTDLDFGISYTPDLGKLFVPTFSFDYYDFIGIFKPESQPRNFQDFINHMRIGAELEILTVLNVRAQYYQEFFTLGAGVDLLFFEVFGEFLFNQAFTDVGASVLVKLHF